MLPNELTSNCEEQRSYERRKDDDMLQKVCDRLHLQDKVLGEHTKALESEADELVLINEQLSNHRLFMQDMMNLHKEAMELHNEDVDAGKKSRRLIRENSTKIDDLAYAMEVRAKSEEPILEMMKEVKEATSIMGWFVKRWRATSVLAVGIITYAVDIWHDIAEFVKEVLK